MYGEIDFGVFKEIVDFQAAHGTSELLVMGSAGELTMLSFDEKCRIIKEISPYAKRKIPVFFGTTCARLEETIRLAQFAESNDADGVLFVVPLYITPPDEGIYTYLKTVMEGVEIPVAFYNNPSRVGVNVEPDILVRLSQECENFVADKEAMGSLSQIQEVLGRANKRVHVLCCDYPGCAIIMPPGTRSLRYLDNAG